MIAAKVLLWVIEELTVQFVSLGQELYNAPLYRFYRSKKSYCIGFVAKQILGSSKKPAIAKLLRQGFYLF